MSHSARTINLLDEVRFDRLLPALARSIRKANGITQERLARELGVQRVTVARWEAGTRRPRGARAVAYESLLARLYREVA